MPGPLPLPLPRPGALPQPLAKPLTLAKPTTGTQAPPCAGGAVVVAGLRGLLLPRPCAAAAADQAP